MARATRDDGPGRPVTLEEWIPAPGPFDADRMVDDFIVLAEWLRGREDTGCRR
jgi:hypothetical protein